MDLANFLMRPRGVDEFYGSHENTHDLKLQRPVSNKRVAASVLDSGCEIFDRVLRAAALLRPSTMRRPRLLEHVVVSWGGHTELQHPKPFAIHNGKDPAREESNLLHFHW